MIGCGQEVLHGDVERAREALEIVETDIGAGALQCADVSAMQTAAFRQLFLRPPAHEAQEPQLARKLNPCLPFHAPISGTAARAVYSGRRAKRWRYATSCSAFIASLALAALTLSACAQTGVAPAPTLGEIARTAKDTCANADDCAVIGIGARACGGPADYLVYSRAASDGSALMREVARYNAAQAEAVRRSGMMSTCDVVPAPGVACHAGRCVAALRADVSPPLAPQ